MTEDKEDQNNEPTTYIADLTDFQPDPDNLNLHTQRGQKIVTESQQKRGYARPAFAANDGTVLGGNLSTMEVAPDIGLGNGKVLVVETSGDIPIIHKRLDIEAGSVEARLLAADDNRSSEVSLNWDPSQLLLDKEAGVDFSGLFYENEFDEITKDVKQEPPPAPGDPPVNLAGEAQKLWQVKKGDVWQLGRHKIACIDSLDEEVVKELIGNSYVGMVWADPPYGISAVDTDRGTINSGNPYPFGGLKNKVTGTVGSGNLIPANRYSPIIGDETGEVARKAVIEFLSLFPDVLHVWWGANHYSDVLPASSCWIIWDKKDDLPSNDFADGEMAWVKSKLAIRIFRHRWSGLVKASEHGQRRVHPTQKPVALFEWAANKYFKEGGIVFDPFLGSGISVIGAENIGDKISVIGCELSPEYIAVVIQRWVDLTGLNPVLVENTNT